MELPGGVHVVLQELVARAEVAHRDPLRLEVAELLAQRGLTLEGRRVVLVHATSLLRHGTLELILDDRLLSQQRGHVGMLRPQLVAHRRLLRLEVHQSQVELLHVRLVEEVRQRIVVGRGEELVARLQPDAVGLRLGEQAGDVLHALRLRLVLLAHRDVGMLRREPPQ